MRSHPLEILRGLAILLVLGRHADLDVPGREGVAFSAIQPLLRGGWAGVDLFFVLSGFLISGLLFKEYMAHGNVKIGRFLVRRGLKIYPAFYAYLAIMLLSTLTSRQAIDWRAVGCEALFIQNYGANMFPHTLSLAIEEHFYLSLCLGFAVCLHWRHARPFAAVPAVFTVMAGTCLVMRLAMARDLYSHKTHLLPTHLRIGALLFGVLLSYWYHFRQEDLGRLVTKRRLLLLVAGLVLVVPCFLVAIETSVYVYTIGLTASYAGWGCVLLAAVYWQPGQLRWTRWIWALLAAIGFYSYSIYLWHVFARRMVVTALLGFSDRGVALPHALELLLYVVAALLIGTLMARTIESPFLRLRDHWFPSRGKALEFAQPKR